MEVLAFQIRTQFPGLFGFRRVAKPKEFKVAVHKNLEYKLPSVVDKMEPRRSVLRLIGVNLIFGNSCAVLAAPVQEMQEPDVIRTLKLGNGVRIQDILEGEGKEAQEGDLVEFNYVCRRSNGYFVHSTVDQFSGESAPVVLPLDDRQVSKITPHMVDYKELGAELALACLAKLKKFTFK